MVTYESGISIVFEWHNKVETEMPDNHVLQLQQIAHQQILPKLLTTRSGSLEGVCEGIEYKGWWESKLM